MTGRHLRPRRTGDGNHVHPGAEPGVGPAGATRQLVRALRVVAVVAAVVPGSMYSGHGVAVLAGATAGLGSHPPAAASVVPGEGAPVPVTPAGPPPGPVQDAVVRAVGQVPPGITEDVVVVDRHTGRTVGAVRAGELVPAMSLVKLFFAADVLLSQRVDQPTLARLHRMIATSDDSLASEFYVQGGAGKIIERIAARYHLAHTLPSPEPGYWGDIRVTAADLASFLSQALADPRTGPFLTSAMRATTRVAADGLDQAFGMGAVAGAGSKQGWGCCLGGVVAVHSVGVTADRIVVVLSAQTPDSDGLRASLASLFDTDPGFLAAVAAVTATARAATG